MCGRFAVFDDSDIMEMEQIVRDIQEKYGKESYKSGEVFPTNNVITVAAKLGPVVMKWGFPKWDGKGVIINARSETAGEKKTFMQPLKENRCVIPCSGFYEWDKSKNKYLFTHEAQEANPVLYLAGIYNTFSDGQAEYRALTILTRAANDSIKNIHNRMPVIVCREEIQDFIDDLSFADFVFKRDSMRLDSVLV